MSDAEKILVLVRALKPATTPGRIAAAELLRAAYAYTLEETPLRAEDDPRRTVYGVQAPKASDDG